MGDLSENFDTTEFTCKCGCGYAFPSDRLIVYLQEMRDKWGYPITVNSGCRCPVHNSDPAVNGSRNSYHLNGMGADITPKDHELVAEENEWELKEVMRRFYRLAKNVFDGNGIIFYPGRKFVHVDVRGYRYLPFPIKA